MYFFLRNFQKTQNSHRKKPYLKFSTYPLPTSRFVGRRFLTFQEKNALKFPKIVRNGFNVGKFCTTAMYIPSHPKPM